MKYILEDKSSSPLSKLFLRAYKGNSAILSDIIFAEGNINTYKVTKKLLTDYPNDIIVVFLDMVPGSSEITGVYNKLRKLSIRNNYRIVVIPIVCFEYYFVSSFKDEGIFFDGSSVDFCRMKKPHFDSPILVNDIDRAYCTSFERLCKLMLRKKVALCIRSDKKFSSSNSNYLRNRYFIEDCNCGEFDFCKNILLQDKAIRFIKGFPCFPEGFNSRNLY